MTPIRLVFAVMQNEDSIRWHQHLGHPCFGSLNTLSGVCGFELNEDFYNCCDIELSALEMLFL